MAGSGGWGRQVAAVAVGGTRRLRTHPPEPRTPRDARGPDWGAGGCPQEARVLTERTG